MMRVALQGLRTGLGYGIAGIAGAVASFAGLPLAWVLGPLVTAVLLNVLAFDVRAPTSLRRVGQMIVGATVGLSMTSAVLQSLISWFPLMVLTALASILIAATFSVLFARFARLDCKTAFFAVMPGGLAEMGNIGASVGARMEPIAITQAVRVAIVVCVVPPLLVATGLHTQSAAPSGTSVLPAEIVASLLAVGCGGALIAGAARLNNPWMIGPLLASAVLTATGFAEGHMPYVIFSLGQVLIGFNIGSRFRRSILRQLPRATIIGIIVVFCLLGTMAGYAFVLSAAFDLDYPSAVLLSSPGGTAEMSATAQVLGLNVALVTAFHVTRALLVNAFATQYWRALSWAGFFSAIDRIAHRLRLW